MKKICMILVLCLMVTFAYGQTQIDVKAKGSDEDIPGIIAPFSPYTAKTSIKAQMEFVEGQFLGVGQVVFSTKIFDALGKKVYTIEGVLEGGMAVPDQESVCLVREVTWINLWVVQGLGRVKTSGSITIGYRGSTITLPDTEGKYVPAFIVMAVSPLGEHTNPDGCWEAGWAWAGVMGFEGIAQFGGITYLTKYVEN